MRLVGYVLDQGHWLGQLDSGEWGVKRNTLTKTNPIYNAFVKLQHIYIYIAKGHVKALWVHVHQRLRVD